VFRVEQRGFRPTFAKIAGAIISVYVIKIKAHSGSIHPEKRQAAGGVATPLPPRGAVAAES